MTACAAAHKNAVKIRQTHNRPASDVGINDVAINALLPLRFSDGTQQQLHLL